jgi:hypothetical protein
LLHIDPVKLSRETAIEVDDRFVGDGYGIPTDESREAIELVVDRKSQSAQAASCCTSEFKLLLR